MLIVVTFEQSLGSRRMSVKRTNYALKPSQQVFAQRGDRACGGIDTLLTYEQFFTLRHI